MQIVPLCASADGHRGPASAVPNGGSDASMARGTFMDRDLGHLAPGVLPRWGRNSDWAWGLAVRARLPADRPAWIAARWYRLGWLGTGPRGTADLGG
jgi:hypothetical protein